MFFNRKNHISNMLLVAVTNLLTCLILSTEFVVQVSAATALEEIEENPAHPDKCYIRDTGAAYALGSTWQVPDMVCAEATCYQSGSKNKFLVAYQTCGSMTAEPPCQLVQDLTLPYPSCCPRFECRTPLSYDSNESDSIKPFPGKIDSQSNEIERFRSNPIMKSMSHNGAQQSAESVDFKKHANKQEPTLKKPLSILDILNHPKTNNKKNNLYNKQDTDHTNEPLFTMEARAPQKIRQQKISQSSAPSNLIYPNPLALILSKSWSL